MLRIIQARPDSCELLEVLHIERVLTRMSIDPPARDTLSLQLAGKVARNLFLLLFSVYVLTSSGNTVDVTEDSMVRQAVTEDLVMHGSFALPEEMGRHWGVRGVDGRYYTNHGLGQSLLA